MAYAIFRSLRWNFVWGQLLRDALVSEVQGKIGKASVDVVCKWINKKKMYIEKKNFLLIFISVDFYCLVN